MHHPRSVRRAAVIYRRAHGLANKRLERRVVGGDGGGRGCCCCRRRRGAANAADKLSLALTSCCADPKARCRRQSDRQEPAQSEILADRRRANLTPRDPWPAGSLIGMRPVPAGRPGRVFNADALLAHPSKRALAVG